MLKSLKALARRDATGSLSGKQLSVGERVVKVDKLLGEGEAVMGVASGPP